MLITFVFKQLLNPTGSQEHLPVSKQNLNKVG